MTEKQIIAGEVPGHWTPTFISSDTERISELVGRNIIAHSLEHHSVSRRPVTVRYRSANLNAITLHEMSYSMFGEGEAHIFVPEMSQFYLCEINRAGDMAVGQKSAETPFLPGQIYMINANAPHAKKWRSDGDQLMILIHQKDMEAAVERLTGRPLANPVLFDPHPLAIGGLTATLDDFIQTLCRDLENPQSFFARTAAQSAAEMIIELMLRALPNNHTRELSDPSPQIRPRHVRNAAQFIHLHAGDTINLVDLVAASGVSERSLHAGFRKYYGVSPMTYLRNVRLDLARQALKEPKTETVSVTGVALTCGFTHLSKFAGAYKERFGELPSETLRDR